MRSTLDLVPKVSEGSDIMAATALCPRCAARPAAPAIPIVELQLAPLQRRLLHALAAVPGKVVPYSTLIEAMWGDDAEGGPLDDKGGIHENALYLKRALAKAGSTMRIVAHAGVGYELV
jgi:DNA-binding response OmpR family regulator